MQISSKAKTGIWIFIGGILSKAFDYIIETIIRLNVENAAESAKIDDKLSEQVGVLAVMNKWIFESLLPNLSTFLDFITGPYGIGFVLGALFVGFSEQIWFTLTRPMSWVKSFLARKKTGLLPLVFKNSALQTKALFQDGKQIRLNHLDGDIAGYEPALASVLVQSGRADYYVFWDEWRHQSYQKNARGMKLQAFDLNPEFSENTPPLNWAKGSKSISIKNASCALSSIRPDHYDISTKAKAIAEELIDLASRGWIKTTADGDKSSGGVTMIMKGQPPHASKTSDLNTMIFSRELIKYSQDREYDVSWIDNKPAEGEVSSGVVSHIEVKTTIGNDGSKS